MLEDIDPTGVIHESYRIDGISAGDCRTIFLDWALGLPAGVDQHVALVRLVAVYGDAHPDHPMTEVLRAGLSRVKAEGRRGGRAGRQRLN